MFCSLCSFCPPSLPADYVSSTGRPFLETTANSLASRSLVTAPRPVATFNNRYLWEKLARRSPRHVHDGPSLPHRNLRPLYTSALLRPSSSAFRQRKYRNFESPCPRFASERCTNDYWQTINENFDTMRCGISILGWLTKIIPRLNNQRA